MNRARLTETLKRHEGFRATPYHDAVGKLTVGYGRNLEAVGVSTGMAESMLQEDIEAAVAGLDERLPWWRALDDVRQEVLVNMAFNVGLRGLLGFRRMLAAAEAGDYDTAADEMLDSRWEQQVGARAHELAAMMRQGPDV